MTQYPVSVARRLRGPDLLADPAGVSVPEGQGPWFHIPRRPTRDAARLIPDTCRPCASFVNCAAASTVGIQFVADVLSAPLQAAQAGGRCPHHAAQAADPAAARLLGAGMAQAAGFQRYVSVWTSQAKVLVAICRGFARLAWAPVV